MLIDWLLPSVGDRFCESVLAVFALVAFDVFAQYLRLQMDRPSNRGVRG